MTSLLLLSWRDALRGFIAPVAAVGGLLLLLAARDLGILALGGDSVLDPHLVGETALWAGCLPGLLYLLRSLDQDARSGFALAAGQLRAPEWAWVLARVGGAWLASCVVALVVVGLGTALGGTDGAQSTFVYSTIIVRLLQTLCLAALLFRLFSSPGLVAISCVAGIALSHLPWGTAECLPGPAGTTVALLLPAECGGLSDSLGRLLAAAGLFSLAVAVPRPWRQPA